MQAIVLLEKLPELDRWTEERRAAAAYYAEALSGVGDLRLPPVPAGERARLAPVSGPHRRVVRAGGVPRRRAESQPVVTTRLPCTSRRPSPGSATTPGDFPVAETLAAELLSLPMFPGITEAQLEAVPPRWPRTSHGG